MPDYYLQGDGVSKLILGDGSGFYILGDGVPVGSTANNFVPVRYVIGETANVVPVETVATPGIGVVPVREFVGPANVVPVRETSTEIPRTKVTKV